MTTMQDANFSRRSLLAATTAWGFQALAFADTPAPPPFAAVADRLARLERTVGGRLGAAVLHTATGEVVGNRLDERFGMCSTFKLPVAAAILREVDQGRMRMDQWVPFTQAEMVPHAPVTAAQLAKGGMTVRDLAEAAQKTSDNVAANLLIQLIGGPAGMTAILRAMGDTQTRVDRMEPDMNRVMPGEEHDTTTPRAMAETVSRIVTGRWLSKASTALLTSWMVETDTGRKRLRAGFPKDWRAGDKTGTAMAPGMADKYNDLAVVWPKGKPPLVVTAFYETPVARGGRMRDADQRVLADVGRIATQWQVR